MWGFEITQPGRIFHLYAATEAERIYWCEGLVEQIARIKKAAGHYDFRNLCINYYQTTLFATFKFYYPQSFTVVIYSK